MQHRRSTVRWLAVAKLLEREMSDACQKHSYDKVFGAALMRQRAFVLRGETLARAMKLEGLAPQPQGQKERRQQAAVQASQRLSLLDSWSRPPASCCSSVSMGSVLE